MYIMYFKRVVCDIIKKSIREHVGIFGEEVINSLSGAAARTGSLRK